MGLVTVIQRIFRVRTFHFTVSYPEGRVCVWIKRAVFVGIHLLCHVFFLKHINLFLILCVFAIRFREVRFSHRGEEFHQRIILKILNQRIRVSKNFIDTGIGSSTI